MKAIIAGGGIGGLTAALCLHRIDWQVEVLEQTPRIGEVGAGLQISPNAMKVLTALDLANVVAARAVEPEALELRRGSDGERIFSIPLKEAARARWGASYLHVHRADLIAELYDAVSTRLPGALHLDSPVASFRQTPDEVTTTTADGRHFTADLLIGADGIHSVVREGLLGPDAPRFTGNVAWRATVPIDRLGGHAPPSRACVWTGPGRHAVTYRLRRGELANLVAVVEQTGWEHESWSARGNRDQLLAQFDDWHPVVRTLIQQTDEPFRWALFDRAPLSRWFDERVALLGDACHPMLPFLAQGAAMAIEDAWTLAYAVNNASVLVDALAQYQSLRRTRTMRVQRRSLANRSTFHYRNPLAQDFVYGSMRFANRFAPAFVHSRQDWLYGYQPPGL